MLRALPEARERRNKDKFLVKLLISKWSSGNPSENALIDLCRDYDSANRSWRKLLEELPSIRGKDYLDGKALSQVKQLELGAESGYHKLSTHRLAS